MPKMRESRTVKPAAPPAPKIKRERRVKLWATDHRALVLEAVATCPQQATTAQILRDCQGENFKPSAVKVMVYQLRHEGLLGRHEDSDVHFLTLAGLDWLTRGHFDRALPCYAERPKARSKRKRPLPLP